MEKVRRYFEDIYENRICDEYDHILPIVGDEGVGKSTFILESIVMYREIRGLDRNDHDAILGPLCYTRKDVKDRMANAERRAIIAVPDAGRVLHKKEAMKGEQVEIEKDIADVRTKEFLFLLGFQGWGMIPTFMQERRAKNVFYLPERGLVRGYNRKSLNKKEDMEDDAWPRSDLTDTFPALDGTDLWERYKELDREKKEERMAGNGTGTEDPADVQRAEAVKTALRAVRPWDDNDGMTYREAAKLIDYSRSWVGDRVKEWEDGEHRGLFGQDTGANQEAAV